MLISVECLICEEYMANCYEDAYLPILHLSRVELRCKLQVAFRRQEHLSDLYRIDGVRKFCVELFCCREVYIETQSLIQVAVFQAV